MMEWLTVTSVLLTGVFSLLVYMIWKSNEKFKTFAKIGLPSPPTTFLIGNARELNSKGFCDCFVEWGKKYGKMYGAYLPGPVLVVSDPEIMRELMVKKFAAFCNRGPQPGMNYKPWSDVISMLTNDHWRHVRQQLSPTFSSGKLKKMVPAINRVVTNLDNFLKDKAETGEEVELKHVAGCFTMDSIAGAAFGIHVDSLKNPDDPFYVNGLGLFNLKNWIIPLLLIFPWMSSLLIKLGITFIPAKPTKFFMDIVDAALKDRRKEQKSYGDFMQLLADLEKEGGVQGPVDAEIDHSDQLTTSKHWTRKGGLTVDEINANAMTFFLAGYENNSLAISFTLFHLAANPEALKKAQDEIDEKLKDRALNYDTVMEMNYLDMCMNETLRLYPPGFIIDRHAAEDTELGGYPVKKDTFIMIPVYALHRDPEYFPEPEKFIPERHTAEAKAQRHPFVFMPFGHGPRNCIGMRLAQLQTRMALAGILQHYTPVLTDKSVYPPVLKPPQLQIKPVDGLWVKFQPRG